MLHGPNLLLDQRKQTHNCLWWGCNTVGKLKYQHKSYELWWYTHNSGLKSLHWDISYYSIRSFNIFIFQGLHPGVLGFMRGNFIITISPLLIFCILVYSNTDHDSYFTSSGAFILFTKQDYIPPDSCSILCNSMEHAYFIFQLSWHLQHLILFNSHRNALFTEKMNRFLIWL